MNTHANPTRATWNLTTLRRRTLNLVPALGISALGLGALVLSSGTALAQSSLHHFKGGIFRPSSGTWLVQPTATPGLNFNAAGSDQIDILLPPSDNSGVPQSVELQLAPFDPLITPLIQPGAELTFTSYGELGGVPNQPISSLHCVKLPDGRVQYGYDFSPLGATTYTLELWDGATQVAVYNGLPFGGGGGPLFTPDCTCPTCPASWYCCWLGAVYYSNGYWHNAYWCAIPIDVNGNNHNANRIVVIPENPTVPVGDLSMCSFGGHGIPSFEVNDLTLTGFGSVGTSYCNANPNSTGQAGLIAALGSNQVAVNDLDLHAFQLPQNAFGYFIVSPAQAFIPNAGGSQGTLCVGASTGRFRSQLANSGAAATIAVHVDLTNLPQPNGSVAVQGGETWNFQCWHRDANPNATSNFTAGYSITFQ